MSFRQDHIDLDDLEGVDRELVALRRSDDSSDRLRAVQLLPLIVAACLTQGWLHNAMLYAADLDRIPGEEDDETRTEAKLRIVDLFQEAGGAEIARTLLHRWKLTRRHEQRSREARAPRKEAA